jgi:hypothetical protein
VRASRYLSQTRKMMKIKEVKRADLYKVSSFPLF